MHGRYSDSVIQKLLWEFNGYLLYKCDNIKTGIK